MFHKSIKLLIIIIHYYSLLNSQTHLISDPYNLLLIEKKQFDGKLVQQSNLFRPVFLPTDSINYSITLRAENFFNNNNPNQENMDVRYFSKGSGLFYSLQLAINSPYFAFMFEPYHLNNNFFPSTNNITRGGPFSVLNDRTLSQKSFQEGFIRNFLVFLHYKGFGFGLHKGNRWWGPGKHTSFQMTNNTQPFMGQIFGTINEIKIGKFGLYGLYTFVPLNRKSGYKAKYFTSLNGSITYYGSLHFTLGFSRNYLTGGVEIPNYTWTEKDAKKIILEGIFISNLLSEEYTVGGHDAWDQTLSTYITVTFPKRNIKLFSEIGMNDNRMYFADFLSQPDHSMATIFGFRDYGIRNNKNLIWGFEWTNLMITYTSRHRPLGGGEWYEKNNYEFSSYNGRRWGAHSGTDSDDWYLYAGYLSDKLMIIPALNYERHGIVSHRPAEVKIELRLNTKYKYKNIWFGVYFEKQFEAFLGFPDYFYVDNQGNPTGYYNRYRFANSRSTNTIIFSLSKNIFF